MTLYSENTNMLQWHQNIKSWSFGVWLPWAQRTASIGLSNESAWNHLEWQRKQSRRTPRVQQDSRVSSSKLPSPTYPRPGVETVLAKPGAPWPSLMWRLKCEEERHPAEKRALSRGLESNGQQDFLDTSGCWCSHTPTLDVTPNYDFFPSTKPMWVPTGFFQDSSAIWVQFNGWFMRKIIFSTIRAVGLGKRSTIFLLSSV